MASSSTLFKHGAFGPNQTFNNRSCSEPPNHDIKQDDKPMDTGRKGLKKESDTNKSTGNTRFETVGHQEASDARGITTKPRSNVGQTRNSLGYGRPAATTVHLKVGKGRQLPDADLVRAASSRNETWTADPKGTKLRPLSSSHTPRPNMNRSGEYHAPGRTPSTSLAKSKTAFDAAPKLERTNSDIVNSNARTSFRSNTSSSSHPRRLSPISQHSVQNGQSSVSRLKITPQLSHLSSKLTPVRTESSGNHFTSRIATPAIKEDKSRTTSSGSRLAPVSSANSFTRQRNPSGHDSSRIEAKHNLINQSQLVSKSGQSKIG